jgi:hypothetical protein
MMKRGKLKSISLSRDAYEQLRTHALEQGVAMSTIVEQAVAGDIGITPELRPSRRYRGPRK